MGRSTSSHRVTATGFLLWMALGFCGCPGESHDRPDIVIICIDALRADHLGCYGYGRDTSPNIDALGERSTLFENLSSASSWTKSAVPSLFTGLLPSEHGVFEGSHRDSADRITSDVLGADLETMAEVLKERGYRTAAFVENAQLRAFLGFDQGFDVYEEDAGEVYQIVDGFLEWYQDRDDAPSFAYLHILDPHWPYVPHPPFDTRFGRTESEMDFATKKYRALRDRINSGGTVPAQNDLARMVELYDGLIAQVDDALGRMFETFDALENPPVVIITADHGEEFYEDGKIGHGHSLSERLLHIPMIVFVPGREPARRSHPCSLIDLYPTVCALSGAEPPRYITGRDLLASGKTRKPSFVIAERQDSNRHLISWREGDLKLIRSYQAPDDGQGEGEDRFSEGLRVEVRLDGEMLDDASQWRADKIEIKEDQTETGLEVQGLLEVFDREKRLVRVLGLEGRLRADVTLTGVDGAELALSDLVAGQPVEIDGKFDDEDLFKIKKLRQIKPDSYSHELEGFIRTAREQGREWLIDLGGRTILVDRDSRFKDERTTERNDDERSGPNDALRPAGLLSLEGLKMKEQFFDLSVDREEKRDLSETRQVDSLPLARRLEKWLARTDQWFEGRKSERAVLDEETIKDLKAIGYMR